MKKFLLSVLVLIGAQAQAQVTTVDCDLTYMVVNVGSNPNSVNIYHSGHYLTHPQEYNVIAWEITDTQGNLISQDTIIENAFYAFSHDMPITDTINVSAHLTNDSAIHEGFPVSCLLEDQLYWEITEVIPGSFISSWSFVHGNLGVDQNSALDSCIGNPIEGCVSIAVWDPVCGCDDETYSNSADAACNSILNSTPGECLPIDNFTCTSNSGIQIIEVGFWENSNDPCDTGECTSDGQFLEIIIDCQEETGIPCNGQWVEVDGQCCSECIEDLDCIDQDTIMSSIFSGGMSISSCSEAVNYLINNYGYSFENACSWDGAPMFNFDGMILSDYCQCTCADIETELSYCDSISLNPILPFAGGSDDTVLVVNIETYFSNYSIPYGGLMLIDDIGDTIAIEMISTAGNVYGIFSNMSETRELFLVNELAFPFNGELCIVENIFAGQPNIVCSYPVIWQNMDLDQIQNERDPKFLRMIDILGRDIKIHQSGQLLFYIYDNGKVDKKFMH